MEFSGLHRVFLAYRRHEDVRVTPVVGLILGENFQSKEWMDGWCRNECVWVKRNDGNETQKGLHVVGVEG